MALSSMIPQRHVKGRHNWYVQITLLLTRGREARDGYGNIPRRDDRRTVVWRHLPTLTHRTWSWYRIHGPLPQDSGSLPRFSCMLALPCKKRIPKICVCARAHTHTTRALARIYTDTYAYICHNHPHRRSVTPDRQNRRYRTTKCT